MTTIERRLSALEQRTCAGPSALLVVEGQPLSDEQRRELEDAERTGRMVLVVVPVRATRGGDA